MLLVLGIGRRPLFPYRLPATGYRLPATSRPVNPRRSAVHDVQSRLLHLGEVPARSDGGSRHVLDHLRAHGPELVGELEQYENIYPALRQTALARLRRPTALKQVGTLLPTSMSSPRWRRLGDGRNVESTRI